MFTTQVNYWETMNEMLQETYKMSLQSTSQFQDHFSRMLKETVDMNVKNTTDFHRNMQEIGRRTTDAAMETLQKFSQIYTDNTQKGIEAMRELFTRYRIENENLRKEMENLLKANGDAFSSRTEELSKALRNNQEKQMESLMKTYTEGTREIIEEFNKKLEEMKNDRK